MATTRNHGGGCCGMTHFSGFRAANQTENVRSLRTDISLGQLNDRKNVEVILSNLQTQNNPELVDELARQGYVYTTSFTGQHGTPVHVFHRANRRLALSAAAFYPRWVENGGMVANSELSGNLPVATAANIGANVPAARNNNNHPGFRIGDRVRVNSPASMAHGQIVTLENIVRDWDVYKGVFRYRGHILRIVTSNLVRVDGGENNNNNRAEPTATFRHPTTTPAAVSAPAARRILREYFASFRDGRIRGPFNSSAEVRAAYPRVANYVRRDVHSDGRVETTDPLRFL